MFKFWGSLSIFRTDEAIGTLKFVRRLIIASSSLGMMECSDSRNKYLNFSK